MALKRYFLLAAVSTIVWAFCSVIALCVFFDRRNSTIETIVAIIAQPAVLGVGPFIAIVAAFAFTRKSLRPRPSNYPRIEHLRIAGKYHAVGSSAEMGISPLHLRG